MQIQALAETKLMSPLLIGELTDMTLSAKYIFHVWLWVGKEPVPAAMLSKQGGVLGTGARLHAPRSREQPASLHGGWISSEVPGCTPKTRASLRAKLTTCPVSFPERCLHRWQGHLCPPGWSRRRWDGGVASPPKPCSGLERRPCKEKTILDFHTEPGG